MLKKITVAVFLALAFVFTSFTASASESTTYTYTISVDGNWIRTQDAYMPSAVLLRDQDLNQPGDIFIKNNLLYVADTGNSRVLIYNLTDKTTKTLGEGILNAPAGLFVTDDGTVYVADTGAKAVFLFHKDGSLRMKIKRPEESPLFGENTVFEPKNVAVTSQGNIFVVGVGTHEGIMQFNSKGQFQGFFAANKRNLTLLERIQEAFFTDRQKEQLIKRTSRPIENIDITNRDLLCSVTQDAGVTTEWRDAETKIENRVKLHNMTGTNILSPAKDIDDEWNFVDVTSDVYGQIYTLSYTGVISEYDYNGDLLFSFGGRSMSADKNGLFTVAAAIHADENGFLYVLDQERALVQVFYPTAYAVATHKAVAVLKNGDYTGSEMLWKEILDLNGMSKTAHIGYGKALFHQQRFQDALREFRIANDKESYSEAFWEIRNDFFNKAMPYILGGLIALYVIGKFSKLLLHRKKQRKKPVYSRLRTDLMTVFTMLRHPLDVDYDLKHGTKGSMLSASLIYLITTLIFVLDTLFRGYLFAPSNRADISIAPVLIMFLVPLALFLVGNAMVASINEGEGSFRNVYTVTAYALSPYIVITPFVVLLSYGVTYNESFLLQLFWFIGVAWSAVYLFVGTMRTHNYTVSETVKNLLLTVFFMLMTVVAAAIIYVMWRALVSFFGALFGEVQFHVAGV